MHKHDKSLDNYQKNYCQININISFNNLDKVIKVTYIK